MLTRVLPFGALKKTPPLAVCSHSQPRLSKKPVTSPVFTSLTPRAADYLPASDSCVNMNDAGAFSSCANNNQHLSPVYCVRLLQPSKEIAPFPQTFSPAPFVPFPARSGSFMHGAGGACRGPSESALKRNLVHFFEASLTMAAKRRQLRRSNLWFHSHEQIHPRQLVVAVVGGGYFCFCRLNRRALRCRCHGRGTVRPGSTNRVRRRPGRRRRSRT